MKYRLRLVPSGTVPHDQSLKIAMQPLAATPGKEKIVTVTEPAPCVSIFAGYSITGNVDTYPSGGANKVAYQAGASGSFTLTAHGIFCDADTFDWSTASLQAGTPSSGTAAGSVDGSGNPTITIAWSVDETTDTTNYHHLTLRKNGSNWGQMFVVAVIPPESSVVCGAGWNATDLHRTFPFDIDGTSGAILPDSGMDLGTTLSADVTWVVTQVSNATGSNVTTMPTVTSVSADVADGFVFNTFAGTDGDGNYAGAVFSLQAQVAGSDACAPIEYSSRYAIQFTGVNAPSGDWTNGSWDGNTVSVTYAGTGNETALVGFSASFPPGGSVTATGSDGSGPGWSAVTSSTSANQWQVAITYDMSLYDGSFFYTFWTQANAEAYEPEWASGPGDTTHSVTS